MSEVDADAAVAGEVSSSNDGGKSESKSSDSNAIAATGGSPPKNESKNPPSPRSKQNSQNKDQARKGSSTSSTAPRKYSHPNQQTAYVPWWNFNQRQQVYPYQYQPQLQFQVPRRRPDYQRQQSVPNVHQDQGQHGQSGQQRSRAGTGGGQRQNSASVSFQLPRVPVQHQQHQQHQQQHQQHQHQQNHPRRGHQSQASGGSTVQDAGRVDQSHRRHHSISGKPQRKTSGQNAGQPSGKPGRRSTAGRWNSLSETMENGSGDYEYCAGEFELEEPFSETDDEETPAEKEARRKRQAKPVLMLPIPRRRIRTLSGMIPAVGYSPVWAGPTMCLNCLLFFDLPKQTSDYVQHLLETHKIVITDIELIVDLKRYIEFWRHRFGQESIEKIFPLIKPVEGDPLFGKIDDYYLMSEKVPEDRQLRERLALRRLEEVLSCQQREREDRTFERQCLFCRYRTKGNRAKLVHHLYTIHHLNLGSPDNLVFVSEYLDVLEGKLRKNECIYCEKVFPDHNTLTEHMRKKQHREVNPKNNFYDRFYVINYLELGKKWLEVLAEDFEDNTPAFLDSDEEEEEESWNEWKEDADDESEMTVVCLFCDDAFQEATKLLDHMKETHQYDLKTIFADGHFGFYDRVKFINYIRKLSHDCICFACGMDDLRSWPALRKHLSTGDHLNAPIEKERWDKEEYLIPAYDNDNLLCMLDEILELDEEGDFGIAAASVEDKEKEHGEKVAAEQNERDESNKPSTGGILVIPEDLVDLEESTLNDPELRDQLQ